jgi:hypothetical protein
MKKISFVSAIVLVSASIAGLSPAQASQTEAIAIIDTQFSGANVGSNVTNICVSACSTHSTPRPGSQLDNFNHGIIMAEIIRKANPTAHLVLIRAGSTNTGVVSSHGLRDALDWVSKNHAIFNIKVVSASLNAGSAPRCAPTGGVQPQEVTSKINYLESVNVLVVAAAGNGTNRTQLDYPACLSNVVAVTIPNRNGVNSPLLDFVVASNSNFNSSVGVASSRTTSVATALVAANFTKIGFVPNKSTRVELSVVN